MPDGARKTACPTALRRSLLAAGLASIAAGLLIACGGDEKGPAGPGNDAGNVEANRIERNAANSRVSLTIGSKDFPEQVVLGEIYAQAFKAAGYDVATDFELASERAALKALEAGRISGYPEYISTALTALLERAPEDVPSDGAEAIASARGDFAQAGLVAYPPTSFSSTSAIGLTSETAEELGAETISDLEPHAGDLDLYGFPACRQRIDCLVGLEEEYGLEFGSFTPVDIGRRYEVLDEGEADLSIVFTTDAELYAEPGEYTILEDDQRVLPAGNVTFLAGRKAAERAGEDFGETIEKVQGELSLEVMRELNAQVEAEGLEPAAVAKEYLEEYGYVE